MLIYTISVEDFHRLCELVGREQYRQSTQPSPDPALDALVKRLKEIAEATRQFEARRELF